jgi:Flp pilus assembly protein TadB
MRDMPTRETSGTRTDLFELRGTYTDQTARFLLLEFQHLENSFLTNEEGGEKRVNMFFALIAAATAAVGLAAGAEGARLPWIVLPASLALLAFGLLTLRRLMGRNIHTTELLNALRRIRGAFLWKHPEALRAIPFKPPEHPEVRQRDGWGPGKAGFVEVVAAANCILAAAGAVAGVLVVYPGRAWILPGSVALAILFASWLCQLAWVKRVYRKQREKLRREEEAALRWWHEALGPRDG